MGMMSVWQVGGLELMTSASRPRGILCNLGVVGFVVVADVWLVGCGIRGGRFGLVFNTLPYPLSFVSLVSRQSIYEVKYSSPTPQQWSLTGCLCYVRCRMCLIPRDPLCGLQALGHKIECSHSHWRAAGSHAIFSHKLPLINVSNLSSWTVVP